MNTRDLDIGDKVKVRLVHTATNRDKWIPGRVMGFGTRMVNVRFRLEGKPWIYPFDGRDIRPRR